MTETSLSTRGREAAYVGRGMQNVRCFTKGLAHCLSSYVLSISRRLQSVLLAFLSLMLTNGSGRFTCASSIRCTVQISSIWAQWWGQFVCCIKSCTATKTLKLSQWHIGVRHLWRFGHVARRVLSVLQPIFWKLYDLLYDLLTALLYDLLFTQIECFATATSLSVWAHLYVNFRQPEVVEMATDWLASTISVGDIHNAVEEQNSSGHGMHDKHAIEEDLYL